MTPNNIGVVHLAANQVPAVLRRHAPQAFQRQRRQLQRDEWVLQGHARNVSMGGMVD